MDEAREKHRQRNHVCEGEGCKHALHKPPLKSKTPRTAKNPKGAGGISVLDDDTFPVIKHLVLREGVNFCKIAEILGVAERTVESWKYTNYKGFADKLLNYELERQLKTALKNHQEDLDLPLVDGIEDPRLLVIRQKATHMTLETLGKEWFGKDVKDNGDQVQYLLDMRSRLQLIASNDEQPETNPTVSDDSIQGRDWAADQVNSKTVRDI